MKQNKRRNTISAILWKNYLFMMFVSILLVLVPYVMCLYFSIKINGMEEYSGCSAEALMQDDYRQIDVAKIDNLNGSVQVVTGNLKVITLCGEGILAEKELTQAEWTGFLIWSGGVNDIECDILYNEKEKFWLLVELPVADIHFQFVVNRNMVGYDKIMQLFWVMAFSYFALIIICAVLYSCLTARNLRKPFHKLCNYTGVLQRGHYEERVELYGPVEFKELEQGMNLLATELEKEKKCRKQLEENRNQLIRDISHDLKNPLMGIRGYAELCLQKEQLSQQQMREYLELILHSSIRANELLMGLFEYAKVESADFVLHVEETDLGEFLRQELIDRISELESRHFTYEADIPEKAMPAKIDVMQMKRVFANLFSNAIKYNPENTAIFIALRKQKDQYEIIFSDSGVGMEEQYRKTIFEPFRRTDDKVRNSNDGGSGLGLAIVKKIITLHGGMINLDTEVGKGTRFFIYLPF